MGKYVIVEACDLAGKSTLITNLEHRVPNSVVTRHPGATPIGQHIRTLIKSPNVFGDDLKISPLSAQILMCVDQIEFIQQLLIPSLGQGKTVLADRINFVSGVVYGLAEGVAIADLKRMLSLYLSPVPDHIFLLKAPWEVIESRRRTRLGNGPDRFEDQGSHFNKRVWEIYDTLLTNRDAQELIGQFIPWNRIEYLDATLPENELADLVAAKIEES